MEILYYIILTLLFVPVLTYTLVLLLSPDVETVKSGYPNFDVSIIVACFNEENYILRKINELIRECKQLSGKYEIIVISDGSIDNTNSVLKQFSDKGLIISHFFPERKGKASVLNYGIKLARYPIIACSDSRQEISIGALNKLLKHFANPQIGAVSSRLIHKGQNSLIRSTINKLKLLESNTGSTIGVYGGLYAVRKDCLNILPENTILDDLLISLFVLAKGNRVILEPLAAIYEIKINQFYSKKRIYRIICGLVQILNENWRLISCLPKKYLLFLFVQKYYKLCVPVLLIALSILAFSNQYIFALHFIIICFSLLVLAIFNFSSLINLIRFLGITIKSIRSIKKYNTNLWGKNIV